MIENFIASTIRRLNVRTLMLSLAGLVAVFIGLAASARYLYNMALGPFPLERPGLLALINAQAPFQYYVVVRGDGHADTGYAYITRSDSGRETVEYYYHALVIGNRLLLVKSKSAEIDNVQTGALVDLPAEVRTQVIAKLEGEVPDLQGAFLPLLLDATNFYAGGYLGLAIAAIVGLLSGSGTLLAVYRLGNPQTHPAVKALGRFGVLESVTREIDMEMAQPHEQRGRKVHFTRRWLISTANSFKAMPYRDILWCYKSVTQHRYNGIPTGKTYAALAYDRHGANITIGGKDKEVSEILQAIVRSVPGVLAGYSDELMVLWRKDRASFVQAVEQRRQSGA